MGIPRLEPGNEGLMESKLKDLSDAPFVSFSRD
jgi:hypothetical protein